MPAAEHGPLRGLRVLVTRPAHQAQNLCRMIEEAGGEPLSLPIIEIVPPRDPRLAAGIIDRIQDFGLAVFVSRNAIDRVLDAMGERPWPAGTRIAVVGRGSADALKRHGLRADIRPANDFSSEGLLVEDALRDARGLRAVIFRGDRGRDLIASTLRARGATVTEAEVYRRELPPGAAERLSELASSGEVDAIVVTSNQGLLNLREAAGDELSRWLLSRRLVVISQRAAELARTMGFERAAEVAAEASDAGLLATLCGQR
ncbi:MAG: uroporphyrinogen-III synthase [Gammaproteobacteria bacterium]|jgi:uroporphyrinogen-III synthase|nr:uroporphyrinogen-III synthase [Gammaproteobacteria bacterium]